MSTTRPSPAASKPADAAANPWRFLTALDGTSEIDRRLVQATRRDEVQLISHMVAAARVSVLYSFSGNGKSSIVNAGLIPFLIENRYAVFRVRPRPPWSIDGPTQAFKESILRDVNLPLLKRSDLDLLRRAREGLRDASKAEQDQLDSLIARLEEQARTSAQSERDSDSFKADLKQHAHRPLAEFIGRVQQRLDADTTLAFICDQFEELFVHFGNTPALDEFVTQLGEVWADSNLRVRILFSMREDWVGSLIEFRKAIPDIFRDYFKLKPMTRSRAGNVLTLPLESVGESMEPRAVEAILDDLAASYRRTQQERFSEINLTPSPADDPFIELPALQVVADRLWTTRNGAHTPFSLAHYRSLRPNRTAGDGRKGSPAQIVLDDYLSDLLERLQGTGGHDARELFELRIDCLYLLTDRVRHRRALPEGLLLEELKQVRAQGLDLPAVTAPRLSEALGPLQQARLVREDVSRSGDRQYELAHDFAVRSVVAAWRQLDRERTAALALREQERKRTEHKYAALQGAEQRSTRLLQIAPLFGLGTLAMAMFLLATRFYSESLSSHPFLLGLPVVTFLTILIGGLVRGHTPSAVLAGVGLLGTAGVSRLAYDTVPGIALLIAALVPLCLWSVHGLCLQSGSTRFARLVATLWTEYLEVLKVLPALALPVMAVELVGSFELGVLLGVAFAFAMAFVSARQVAARGVQFGSLWTGVRVAGLSGEPLPIGRALVRQLALLAWIALVVFFAFVIIEPPDYPAMMACGLLATLSWVAGAVFIPSLRQNHQHVYDLVSGAYPGTGALPDPAAHAPRPFAVPKVVARVYAPAFGLSIAGIALITFVQLFTTGAVTFGFVLNPFDSPYLSYEMNRLITMVAGVTLAAASLAFMFPGTRRLAAWAVLATFAVQVLFVVFETFLHPVDWVISGRRVFDVGEVAALALTFVGLSTTDGERAVKRIDAARVAFAIALIGTGASWFLVWSWETGLLSLWSTALQIASFVTGALILSRRRGADACFVFAGMLVLNVIVRAVGGGTPDAVLGSAAWAWVPWTLVSIAGTATWGILLVPRPVDAAVTDAEVVRA